MTVENEELTDEQIEQAKKAKLAVFSGVLLSRRKEAIDARKLSGIEDIWLEDEEYYNGIDDFNRGTMMLKPTTKEGRVSETKKKGSARSTAFVNITQPYVDLVSSREFDMLFPVDDKPFALEPTPIPEIKKLTDSQEMMPDGNMTEGDAAKAYLKEAKDKAEAAETQIWDWLAESNWHTEGRKLIHQKNMLGTGVIKGPFPDQKRRREVIKDEFKGLSLKISQKVQPMSKKIDVWNLYPDPACGCDIHNGSYIWEKDRISGKQLRELKGAGYIDSEIVEILKEGPGKIYLTDDTRRNKNTQFYDNLDMYEIWYYHGYATGDDLMAANCECPLDEAGNRADGMDVCIIMVNDRVIKASQASLNSGKFPYDVFVYQERFDYWAGIGVARQVRTAQNVVNSATRAMLDNAGISAGPQIIYRSGIVRPADGVLQITPHKIWYVDEDATIQDVRDVFMSIIIPNNQQHMEAIIRLALEFAERATSMPLLLQGQQGAATETVGGMQILQTNSNTVLRRTAKLFDDVLERHIDSYYEWLMQYSDDDRQKGDFNILVKGSSALYERDAQNQAILQLVQLAADPAFELSKPRLMIEILKSNKISPDRVTLTDEEKKALQEQPPPKDPALQIAELKSQADIEREKLKQSSDMAEIEAKKSATQDEFALKLNMAETDRQHQLEMKRMDVNLAVMQLAQASNQSVESIKAQLAETTMRLSVQKELSEAARQDRKNVSNPSLTPPTEPSGQADAGHAYEQ